MCEKQLMPAVGSVWRCRTFGSLVKVLVVTPTRGDRQPMITILPLDLLPQYTRPGLQTLDYFLHKYEDISDIWAAVEDAMPPKPDSDGWHWTMDTAPRDGTTIIVTFNKQRPWKESVAVEYTPRDRGVTMCRNCWLSLACCDFLRHSPVGWRHLPAS